MWSVGADGRHVELDLDPVTDQPATRLQRGVPGQPPVAAQDGQGALEADPEVAERVQRRAGQREVDGHRAADVLDGQVTGHRVPVVVELLDAGRGEDRKSTRLNSSHAN